MRNNSILLVIIFSTSLFTCFGQVLPNSNFDERCPESDTGLCNWSISWGSEGCCRFDSNINGPYLRLSNDSENAVSFVEQELKYEAEEMKILEVSASIMTNEVEGKGAGMNIGAYDDSGALLATKDMGGFYSISWLYGTQEWQESKIRMVIPKGTFSIKIGAILYGSGVAGFDDYQVDFQDVGNEESSDLASSYINNAIEIISKNSLYRDSLDFELISETAKNIVGYAKDFESCYLGIEFLLGSLRPFGDNHSFFMTSKEAGNWEDAGESETDIEFPEISTVNDCAYIKVPAFHGGNEDLIKAYGDSLQSGLKRAYQKEIKGWIVDLRENTGGNMEPMILGLGPLLDTGKIGSLVDINGNHEYWYYRNGTYYWEDEKGTSTDIDFNPQKDLPIAVLTSSTTGSSGEIVAISFVGNKLTRSFGQPTWGLTTGNGEFELIDGARLYLASTHMCDRTGKVYSSRIEPGVNIEESPSNNDLVLETAINWILRR